MEPDLSDDLLFYDADDRAFFDEKEEAAIVIQQAWRGYLARRAYDQLREAKWQDLMSQVDALCETRRKLDQMAPLVHSLHYNSPSTMSGTKSEDDAVMRKFVTLKFVYLSTHKALQDQITQFQMIEATRRRRIEVLRYLRSLPPSRSLTPVPSFKEESYLESNIDESFPKNSDNAAFLKNKHIWSSSFDDLDEALTLVRNSPRSSSVWGRLLTCWKQIGKS